MPTPAPQLGRVLLAAMALAACAPSALAQSTYTVTLSPGSVEATPGARVELHAQLYRKDEADTSHYDWDWETTGGTLEGGRSTNLPENVWVAPVQPGTYVVRATTRRARREGNWGQATIVVRPITRNLRCTPAQITLQPGQAVRFAIAMDGGVRSNEIRWAQVQGGTMRGWDTFEAGPVAGDYRLCLQDTQTGEQAWVDVRVRPVLAIEPARVELRPGEQARFTIRHNRAYREDELRWTVVEGGAFVGRRVFIAGQRPGTYRLVLRDATTGEECTAQVTILPSRAAAIAIEPRYTRAEPGQRLRFSAWAFDDENRPVPANVRFEVIGFGGTIDANGWFTAGDVSDRHVKVRVIDIDSGRMDTADVYVDSERERERRYRERGERGRDGGR